MIEIKNITKSFDPKGRHYLFKDLNLTIADKQSVILVVMGQESRPYLELFWT